MGELHDRAVECHVCGKKFTRPPSKINSGKNYCSRSCYNDRDTGRVEKECEVCNTEFLRKPSVAEEMQNHYCSQKCYDNRGKNLKEVECLNCSKTFEVYPSELDHRNVCFCSLDCRYSYMVKEDSPNWRGGFERYYGPQWSELRKRVLERDGYKCVVCGVEECRNGSELHIHHIISFREFESPEEANKMNNLVALCAKHHMLYEEKPVELQKSRFLSG